MSSCSHDCSSCSENCSEKENQIPKFKPHNLSNIKKTIGIISGKGGVGKSLVTSLLAVNQTRRGAKCAILDADITGPSIPNAFGLKEKAVGDENGLFPVRTKTGIDVMSINLLLPNTDDPVVWRGPVIAGAVGQFYTDVIWKDIDYMFIDMPPGTGDVPLTVFQSIKMDGIIIVTSPQSLVSMVVSKAVKMANLMNIPIIGIIENYSYFECPDCKKQYKIYGDSHVDEVASKFGIDVIAKIPIDPNLAKAVDNGMCELYEGDWLDNASSKIENL